MSTDYGSLPDIPANLLAKIRLSSLREVRFWRRPGVASLKASTSARGG